MGKFQLLRLLSGCQPYPQPYVICALRGLLVHDRLQRRMGNFWVGYIQMVYNQTYKCSMEVW